MGLVLDIAAIVSIATSIILLALLASLWRSVEDISSINHSDNVR